MALSDLTISKEWIEQFSDEKKPFARLLLDNLLLVGQEQFSRDLYAYILELARDLPKPIALVPVREMARGAHYYGNDRNAKPRVLLSASLPGSEAIVANIATQLIRLDTERTIFTCTPSLRNLRESRCRSVLLIDDFIGSGNTIDGFFHSYNLHKTIKSWRSGRFIDFFVVAYSGTKIGVNNVSKNKRILNTWLIKECPTILERIESIPDYGKVKRLCLDYARESETMPFGFADTMGSLVFEHSAPNNLPAILWRSTPEWKTVFPGRSIPPEVKDYFTQYRDKRVSLGDNKIKISVQDNIESIARGDRFMFSIVKVLEAMIKTKGRLERVSAETGMSIFKTSQFIEKCKEWELIDNDNKVTSRGVSEIEHARKITRVVNIEIDVNSEFYYPRSLRTRQ